MEKFIEVVRNFVRKEDPVVWQSLIIATIITIVFFIFVLVITRFY